MLFKEPSFLPILFRKAAPVIISGLLATSCFANTQVITVRRLSVHPKSVHVIAGDTIIWQHSSGKNIIVPDQLPAGAVSFKGVLSASLPPFIYVATVPGYYHFKSLTHPLIKGKITVDAAVQPDTVIKIYPQPFQNSLTIDLSNVTGFKKAVSIEVFDALGQLKYKSGVNKNSTTVLDLSSLQPGVYLVNISDGLQRKTYRVIKSK